MTTKTKIPVLATSAMRWNLAIAAWMVAASLLLGGCGGSQTITTPTPTVSSTPTLTPSPSGPPTLTPTPPPTATLEPYTYTVQPGDTLYYVIQLFGYRDLAIVPEVLALNGMASENDPLRAGQVLLIPRQTPTPGPTPTPTPTSSGPTPDPNATTVYTDCNPDNRCISPDGQYWIHIVQPGETVLVIAYEYDSTADAIRRANNLVNDIIYPNQQLKVPILVTLTPTLTPTGGPNSTATPTPTLEPPSPLAPANGETIPRNRNVVFEWATIHTLRANESYLLVLRNQSTGEESRFVTRSNAFRLPSSFQPGIGRSVRFEWYVVIISGNNPDAPVISGTGHLQVFTWGP
jgi:LysM repeat protein